MDKYDTVLLLHNEGNKGQLHLQMYQILSNIKEYNEIGKKRLAYEIRGQTEAEYIEIKWNGTMEDVKELERFFSLNNYILKFITMKVEE